jgi:predicted enzyme related to lactoylglutathione lyase
LDLSVTDLDRSWAFYQDLFGWHIENLGAEFNNYGIAYFEGQTVGAIGPNFSPTPSQWKLSFSVADAEKACAKVTAAGGQLLGGPEQIAEQGVFAIAADPTGALFGIWQPGKRIGLERVGRASSVVWYDHQSDNPDAAREFYASAFDFEYSPMPGLAGYTTFAVGGSGPLAGIGPKPLDLPDAETQWLPYFEVTDLGRALATVSAGAGTVVSAPATTPFGEVCRVNDPEGAALVLLQRPAAGGHA